MNSKIFKILRLVIHIMPSPEISPTLHFDVVIIGGGISGNYLAYLLAGKGISCAVIEAKKSFEARPLQCAGILSQKLLDLVQFPTSIIQNRVQIADIVAPNGQHLLMRGKESPLVIDRIAFDTYFGHQAQVRGAVYYFAEKYLKHWAKTDGTALVQTNLRYFSTKLVVGADGPSSKVAAQMGMKIPTLSAAQVRATFLYDLSTTAMIFDPRWTELFGYIVPEGSNGVCRIGVATSRAPGKALKILLSRLNISSNDIISHQGGLIPYGYPKRIAFQNTVLLGDSGCMVKATTGGGIIMLLSAAQILTPALEKALSAGDFSQRFLQKHYQRPFKRGLGIQLKVHYLIRVFLLTLTPEDFTTFFSLYESSNLSALIAEYADMDFPVSLVLRLLLNRKFVAFLVPIVWRNLHLVGTFFRVLVD